MKLGPPSEGPEIFLRRPWEQHSSWYNSCGHLSRGSHGMSIGGKDLVRTDNDAKVWHLNGRLDSLGEVLALAFAACFLLAGVFIFAQGIHEILANGGGVDAHSCNRL